MTIRIIIIFAVFLSSFALYAEYPRLDMKYLMPLLNSGKTDQVMKYLKENLNNDSKEIRSGVYSVLKSVFDKNPDYRKEIVEIWSSNLHNIYSSRVIYESLYDASPIYYTVTAKQNLIYALKTKENLVHTIRLLGHANVTEAIPLLKEAADKYNPAIKQYHKKVKKFQKENPEAKLPALILSSKFQGKSEMEALPYHEALARMGDKEEIKWCMDFFNREIHTQSLSLQKKGKHTMQEWLEIGNIFYVEDYAYIRQPETVKRLHEALRTNISYNMHGQNIPLNKKGFDALVKCLMIDDVIEKDRFGKYVPNKENIALLQKWMKEHYTPEKIKSLSVLIDGQIVNNLASSSTVTETKHTEKPVEK